MKTCIVIPVYNHEKAIPKVLERLKAFGLPCFLVNDGSSAPCRKVLETCAQQEASWVTLITRAENGGKGGAVLEGFKAAYDLGFSHAIQIDADGQHETRDIPKFLEASAQQPDALIIGQPLFDESAPKSRLYGRILTNVWVWINTLSCVAQDGMCGFRLYPLAAVAELAQQRQIAQHMDFDVDILVRLYWQGLHVVNIPTAVQYPIDGVSHFKLWRDNFMLSKVHARLFFGMLWRMPRLLKRHWQ